MLDLAPLDGSDPGANYATVERELALHDPRLATLPRVLALSKADLVDETTREAARRAWSERLGEEVPVLLTSSVSHLGLETLAAELVRRVPVAVPEPETLAQRGSRCAGAGRASGLSSFDRPWL